MLIIIPFDTGWTIALHLIDKLIYLILLLSWIFQDIVLPRLHSSIDYIYSKLYCLICLIGSIHQHYAGTRTGTKQVMVPEISQKKLRSSKESCCNGCNCKSGKHNRRHTFLRRKPLKIRQDTSMTSLPDLKVKARSDGETKFPSPRRQDRVIPDIHHRKVAEHLDLSSLNQYILPYDEPDLYNDFITKEPDYKDHFNINFPCHCVLGQVLLDSKPLDDLGLW